MEYKTVRQYQAMGDMLDEFKVYGFRNGVENIVHNNTKRIGDNGYGWLTKEAFAGPEQKKS